MKVHFTDEATDDLLRIGDYIARDNPLRALPLLMKWNGNAWRLLPLQRLFP